MVLEGFSEGGLDLNLGLDFEIEGIVMCDWVLLFDVVVLGQRKMVYDGVGWNVCGISCLMLGVVEFCMNVQIRSL